MKAREFVINVPINIKINGSGDPEIDVAGKDAEDEEEKDPLMIPPLQQSMELKKAALGKESRAIDQLITDDVDPVRHMQRADWEAQWYTLLSDDEDPFAD